MGSCFGSPNDFSAPGSDLSLFPEVESEKYKHEPDLISQSYLTDVRESTVSSCTYIPNPTVTSEIIPNSFPSLEMEAVHDSSKPNENDLVKPALSINIDVLQTSHYVDYIFYWPYCASEMVSVQGSFNNWTEPLSLSQSSRPSSPLSTSPSSSLSPTGHWSVTAQVPVGTLTYFFVVDGNRCVDHAQTVHRDSAGKLFNTIYIEDPDFSYDSHLRVSEPSSPPPPKRRGLWKNYHRKMDFKPSPTHKTISNFGYGQSIPTRRQLEDAKDTIERLPLQFGGNWDASTSVLKRTMYRFDYDWRQNVQYEVQSGKTTSVPRTLSYTSQAKMMQQNDLQTMLDISTSLQQYSDQEDTQLDVVCVDHLFVGDWLDITAEQREIRWNTSHGDAIIDEERVIETVFTHHHRGKMSSVHFISPLPPPVSSSKQKRSKLLFSTLSKMKLASSFPSVQ
ncbi:hypothetical protein BLNAU_3782 [Blattamonas nauphoetae]|uniref:AMP-activated protein kinase glycogen-binding domain-containing protein n=1 Tax=Blattamonas nauphoetae TaxID=2049346 RepID=A0ABQ9YC35_9EUKA|nr:hypothetical protein BLNAU_3782 [Blattamonas nauphoetae]